MVLCTNTLHKVAPALEKSVQIPLIHIAERVAKVLQQAGMTKVGFLGTKFTMQRDFYRSILAKYGIETLVPPPDAMDTVHSIIFEELYIGKISVVSKEKCVRIMERLVQVLLGCTELGLLLTLRDVSVPFGDTAYVHARSAAHIALAGIKKSREGV